jgi:hypothetical protein
MEENDEISKQNLGHKNMKRNSIANIIQQVHMTVKEKANQQKAA